MFSSNTAEIPLSPSRSEFPSAPLRLEHDDPLLSSAPAFAWPTDSLPPVWMNVEMTQEAAPQLPADAQPANPEPALLNSSVVANRLAALNRRHNTEALELHANFPEIELAHERSRLQFKTDVTPTARPETSPASPRGLPQAQSEMSHYADQLDQRIHTLTQREAALAQSVAQWESQLATITNYTSQAMEQYDQLRQRVASMNHQPTTQLAHSLEEKEAVETSILAARQELLRTQTAVENLQLKERELEGRLIEQKQTVAQMLERAAQQTMELTRAQEERDKAEAATRELQQWIAQHTARRNDAAAASVALLTERDKALEKIEEARLQTEELTKEKEKMLSEVTALRMDKESAARQIARLTEEQTTLRQEVAENQELVEEARKRRQGIEQEQVVLLDKKAKIQEDIATAEAKLAEFHKALAIAEASGDKAKISQQQSEAETTLWAEKAATAKKEAREAERQLQELTEKVAQLESLQTSLLVEKEALDVEKETLAAKTASVKTEALTLTQSLEHSREEERRLKDCHASLLSEIAEVERRRAAIEEQALLEETRMAEAQAAAKEAFLAKEREQQEALAEKLSEIDSAREELASVKNQLEEIEREVAMAQGRRSVAEEAISLAEAEAEQIREQIKALQGDVAAAEDRVRAAAAEKSRIEDDVLAARERRAGAEALAAEAKAECDRQLEQQRLATINAEAERAEAFAQANATKAELAELKSKLSDTHQELERKQHLVSVAHQALQTAHDEKSRLTAEQEAAQLAFDQLTATLAQLTEQQEKAQRESVQAVAQAAIDIRQQRTRVAQVEEEAASAIKRRDEAQQKENDLKRLCERRAKDLAVLEERCRMAGRSVDLPRDVALMISRDLAKHIDAAWDLYDESRRGLDVAGVALKLNLHCESLDAVMLGFGIERFSVDPGTLLDSGLRTRILIREDESGAGPARVSRCLRPGWVHRDARGRETIIAKAEVTTSARG